MLWFVSDEVAAAKPWMPTCAAQDARWLDEHADIVEQQRAAAALAHHVAARAPMFHPVTTVSAGSARLDRGRCDPLVAVALHAHTRV